MFLSNIIPKTANNSKNYETKYITLRNETTKMNVPSGITYKTVRIGPGKVSKRPLNDYIFITEAIKALKMEVFNLVGKTLCQILSKTNKDDHKILNN